MPITISNRNVGSGNGQLFVPLVANNPAFKVEIIPVDGRLEQKPFAKDDSGAINAIKVGQTIRGKIVNSDKKVTGKVLQIQQENGQITAYKVLTKGKEVLVDPTSATKSPEHGEDFETVGGIDANQLTNGVPNESHVLSYSSWLTESKKNKENQSL